MGFSKPIARVMTKVQSQTASGNMSKKLTPMGSFRRPAGKYTKKPDVIGTVQPNYLTDLHHRTFKLPPENAGGSLRNGLFDLYDTCGQHFSGIPLC